MKRWTFIHGIVCFLAFEAAASEAFVLTIPLREDFQRQTGEVRITLALDSPAPGSQLVVANSATLDLAESGTVGGDFVSFEERPGNQVRIVYRPLSNFPNPNNFCLSAPTGIKEIPLRFNGPQNITSYRISSYAIGNPEIECTKVFKRVGDFPAFITPQADAVAPELTATFDGRHELDVILVLDSSGSMNERPPVEEGQPQDGPPKAAILKSAVNAFIAQWQQIDAGIEGGDFANDRIGVVFFNATATALPGQFFFTRTSEFGPQSSWDALPEIVNGLAAGGTTSIGAGINEAFARWELNPVNDLSLVVVTDGKQNTEPLIQTGANDILSLSPITGFEAELRKRFTPIFTIGFGTPSGLDQALLQNISLQTTGNSFLAVSAQTLFSSFGTTLVNFLKGNTVSLALNENGTLTGAGPSAQSSIVVDRSVPRLVVSVQWVGRANALDLEVIDPQGGARNPTAVSKPGQAVVWRYDLGPNDAGRWRVRVKRALSPESETIPYTLTAFLLEDELDYQLTASANVATGDPIQLRARIAYDRKPLNKLPANAITVRVQRPRESLGTILHDTPARGALPAVAGDTRTPYERKTESIVDAAMLARIYPRDFETVTLTEESPGVYGGTFANTSVAGMYAFEAVLDWDDPRTGAVRRVERLETHVKVKPDPIATTIQTTPNADGSVRIAVTPRDRFGNYTGPGYASVVRATLDGAGSITPAADDPDLTGTYVFTVSDLPAGQTPDVEVIVDGVNVGNAQEDAPAPSAGSGDWRFFLDAGLNHPQSRLRGFDDGKVSINLGAERRLTPHWSVEGILGYHAFEGPLDPKLWQLSVNGKYFFGSGPLRPFANAGAGAYRFDSGNAGTRAGFNGGAGLLYQLTPGLAVEGVVNYHNVNTNADSVSFTTVQVGLRF